MLTILKQHKKFLNIWTKTQEKTLGGFIKYPMIMGPTRETSEKILKSMNASLKFYGSWANFYLKFQIPWTLAMEEFCKQTAKRMKGEVSPKGYIEFYNLWIKTYEETFDGFLRSEEFSSDLGTYINDFMDFKKGYEDIVEDNLKRMSIPTKSDLEAAFKDIYALKRKVRDSSSMLTSFKGDLEGGIKDRDSLRKKLEELSAELVSSKRDPEKLDAVINDFTDFKKSYEDIFENYLKRMSIPTKSDLEAAFKDIFALKRKVIDISLKMASSKSDLEAATKDRDSLRKKLEELSAERVSSKRDLKKANKEITYEHAPENLEFEAELEKKIEKLSKKRVPPKKI